MAVDNLKLEDGLVLHPVRTVRDAASFTALNEAVTGEGYLCERLLHHHPGTTFDHYFGIENTDRGEFISTTCLIPWQLDYGGVRLSTAMLEMVVTHPDYRRRGLIRAQIDHFHRKALDDSYDLCIIQGIPYYYRQYGYAYALDHTPFDTLESRMIPEMESNLPAPYSLRPATL
ncbi:MAG: GNAT family N-acetyltransferase, partial [Anaerolineales bacterium]